MSWTWLLLRIGASQNEHGCNPSRAHMIFPQETQFGAVVNSGCIEELQSQTRRSEDNDGFVDSSRAAMADVKSLMLEVVVFLVFGVDVPEWPAFFDDLDLTFGISEINGPEADGGSFRGDGETSREDGLDGASRLLDGRGVCKASGCCVNVSESNSEFVLPCLGF